MLDNFLNKFWIINNLRSLKNWNKRNFRSPSPEFIKQKILESENINDCLWIETGTYYGETTKFLSKIAKKHTISITKLKKINNLIDDKIQIGQILKTHN